MNEYNNCITIIVKIKRNISENRRVIMFLIMQLGFNSLTEESVHMTHH